MAKLAVTISLFLSAVLFVSSISATPALADSSPSLPPPYTNHTVGGSAGWSFDLLTNTTSADYSAWTSNQTFFLGDFLIFSKKANSTVIQTYNKTTYGLCSLDEDYGNLTTQWDTADVADVLAVPLTEEGDNYYFSSANDGIQCQNGMRFHILVGHGRGLPQELNQPPPPPSASTTAPPPSTPWDATPSSQSETFYNGGGDAGRLGVGLTFSGGFLLLMLLFFV